MDPAKQFGISRRARARRVSFAGALVALVVALALTAAPGASAAGQNVLLPNVTVKIPPRQPQPSGAVAPSGRRSISALSPNPAKLRDAKARAAGRLVGSSLLSPSTSSGSPAPGAALYGGLNSAGMFASGSTTPPDTTGAIGPSNYLEFVNDKGITAYNRSLTPVSGPVGVEEFIGLSGSFAFDPQIQWDANWGRWIYVTDAIEEVEEEVEPGVFEMVTHYYLALGWSKTADPTNLSVGPGGGWCRYAINTGSEFDDYPKLGHSNGGITIGSNVFDLETEQFLTARIWSIAKPASAETCPSTTAGAFGTEASKLKTSDGDTAFTPVPANTADSSSASYVVAADSRYFTPDAQIMGWHVNGGGEGATLVPDGNMNVGSFEIPANVPQPGTANLIDSSDARLTNAVAVTDPAVGQEAVWTQHTIEGAGGRSAVRWYELIPATHTVQQQGTISDPEHFVFNAAISPTREGDAAAIDFNRGSATLFPDMHAQSRDVNTPLGEMQKDVLLGVSSGAAQDFSCVSASEPCRWGDYAGASPDPSVSGVVWGSSQGLASPSGTSARWTTRNFALLTDVTAPAAPTVSSTSPASPANDNSPKVIGSAEAESTVKLYTAFGCTGAVAGTGDAATFASLGIGVSVSDDSTTAFYATATDSAGNTSSCSVIPVVYVEDSTPPGAPTISSVTPASPANNNAPKVKGTAGIGLTVKLYANASCSGAPVATGTTAEFAFGGIAVPVADNSVTTFHATASDAAENASTCSGGSVEYVEDSAAPETTIDLGPSRTTSDSTPSFTFSASEGGSAFECSVDGGGFSSCNSPLTTSTLADGSHSFQVRARDVAGNVDSTPASRTFEVTAARCLKAKGALKKAKRQLKKAKTAARKKKAKAAIKKAKREIGRYC